MMSSLSSVVRRHPLITFFVLTYALTWLAWPLWALGLYPIAPVFSFAPFLTALVVLAITQGKSGIGGLLRRMVRWRVGLRWYVAALLIPAGITVAAAVLNILLGAQAPSSAELGGWTGLLPIFLAVLLIPSLILGVLIAGWHLPLMFVGQVHYSDIVTIMGAVIIFNWVFNNANGSVLIIMVMHAMNNAISGSFFFPMFSGADSVRQGWLVAAGWCAVAIVVVLVAGPAHLSRKHHKQEEREEGAEVPGATSPTVPPVPRPA